MSVVEYVNILRVQFQPVNLIVMMQIVIYVMIAQSGELGFNALLILPTPTTPSALGTTLRGESDG